MSKNSKKKIYIGSLALSPGIFGAILCIILSVIIAVILFVTGIISNPAASSGENQIVHALHPYTISEITGGHYYIKDGNSFYLPAYGTFYSSADKDTMIATAAKPYDRIVMYGMDDIEIPTMYSDSLLIYKAKDGEMVPEEVVLERYQDEGYSIGIRGLDFQGNKCHTKVSNVTFYPGCSISTINISQGNDLIIDKIDGTAVTEKAVTTIGTIKGLSQGKTYTVDAYSGTTYIGGDFVADTHMFSSMERFVIDEYSMDPSNYAILDFPKDLWSGYYYVNGIGMIRYINHPKSMGNQVDDFNTPYYIKDESGNIVTNPSNVVTEEDELDEENAVWSYRFSVEEGKPYLSVRINYSGISHNTGGELVSPEGRRTVLNNDNPQTLTGMVENPSAGAWILNLSGMKNKVFDVTTFYTELSEAPPVSTVIKDSSSPVTAKLTLGKDLNNARITIRWENSEYAGLFTLKGPNKIEIGNKDEHKSKINYQGYGEVRIDAGQMRAGQYDFIAEGKALGHIYITYEDLEPEIVQTETMETLAEITDSTEAMTDNVPENLGEIDQETSAE